MTVLSRMTNGTSTTNLRNGTKIPPPLPFKAVTTKRDEKEKPIGFELRTIPTDADSSKIKFNVYVFKNGTCEEWLRHKKNIRTILTGLNATNGPSSFSIARRLLEGEPLSAFNAKASEVGTETVLHFKDCMDAVTQMVFPQRALQRQRRYMRRNLRKPRDVTIRNFRTRLLELNSYLTEFPGTGGDAQKLDDDDLKELMEFAIPNTWQKAMVLQGFNPVDKTIDDFVEFCERLEFAEQMTDSVTGKNSNASQNESKKRQGHNGSKTSEGAKIPKKKCQKTGDWCYLHKTSDHSFADC